VALFLAAGLGLGELVPAVRTLPWPRRLAWAYLLGLAGLAGALYALSHFFDVPLRRPAILGTAAALVLAGLAARVLRRGKSFSSSRSRQSHRRGGLPPPTLTPGPSPKGEGSKTKAFFAVLPSPLGEGPGVRVFGRGKARIEIAGAALLAFICLGLLAEAVTDPVIGWDARMTWTAQAFWVQDAGTVDAEVLQRKNLYVSHPEYPLLLPVAQVVVLETFAVPQDVHAFRALYAAVFAAFLLLLWDGAVRWAGRLPALLAGLAAAGVPALTFNEDTGAASGYSDLPLACFYGAGLLLLLRSRRSFADALAAGLLLAGAVLTKNEGSLLALFALAAAALPLLARRDRPRQWVRLGAAALLVLLALALLTSWRAGIPNRQDERYDHLVGTRDFWPDVVTRIPFIAGLALRQTFRFGHWTLFWIAVPVVFWAGRRGWRGRRRVLALALAIGAAAPLLIAWGAYSIHPNPEPLIPVTWSRFLIQGSLPLFLLLALALHDILKSVHPGARLARETQP
jgi:hypothetical protein